MPTDDPSSDQTRITDGDSSRPDGADPWPGLQPVPSPAGADRSYRSVGFTISTIGYAVARRFRDRLAPLGLRPRDFALLHSVATTEGVTQQVIAERMRVAPSRMVAFVDSLEERGLLERRPNPDDRRARALFLTPEGRDLLARAFAVPTEQEELLTSDLSDHERDQLLNLLGRVGAQVGVPPGIAASMGHTGLADE
jgi:DNA-binding MarR family transcriptional regulator